MKKLVLSLALGCALAAGLASASFACMYNQTSASNDNAAQTAQAQPDQAQPDASTKAN